MTKKITYLDIKKSLDSHTYQREVTLVNLYGLHARPASAFVKIANNYDDEVTVQYGSKKASGKNLMGLIILGAGWKSKLKITVSGNGTAEKCLDELVHLVETEFVEMDKKDI